MRGEEGEGGDRRMFEEVQLEEIAGVEPLGT